MNLTAKGCLPEPMTPVGSASQPYLTDIADETNPVTVSQFRLPINEPVNCLDQVASQVNASVHYQDVDDPNDTTFFKASMWNAGPAGGGLLQPGPVPGRRRDERRERDPADGDAGRGRARPGVGPQPLRARDGLYCAIDQVKGTVGGLLPT